MKRSPSDRFLRIPVRYVDEHWECEYGGTVPVALDTEAELIINIRSITDQGFLARMKAPSSIKVLDEGVKLLVYVATKEKSQLTEKQKKCLIPWQEGPHQIATEYIDSWSSGGLSLLEVFIGNPTDQQARKFNSKNGGLWLVIEGPQAVGLQSSRIRLPEEASTEPVSSLNHAFTKLSEVFEPWRISHTGNVYQRFLYKEKDGRWYPLELLRDAALAKKEQEIAYQLWQDFMKRVSPSGRGPEKANETVSTQATTLPVHAAQTITAGGVNLMVSTGDGRTGDRHEFHMSGAPIHATLDSSGTTVSVWASEPAMPYGSYDPSVGVESRGFRLRMSRAQAENLRDQLGAELRRRR